MTTPSHAYDFVIVGAGATGVELSAELIEAHAALHEGLGPEQRFRLDITLVEAAGRRVRFCGAFQNHEMPNLMRSVDWVVMPSVWWENSPMVIQEAFVCGRPLLVSDLGGMKEKVVHGFNGFTIPGGNTHEWSSRMREIVSNPQRWNKARINISKPMTQRMIAAVHLKELSY